MGNTATTNNDDLFETGDLASHATGKTWFSGRVDGGLRDLFG